MAAEVTVVQVVDEVTVVGMEGSQVTVINEATVAIRYPAFDVAISPLMYDSINSTLSIDEVVLSDLVLGFTRYVHAQAAPASVWTVNHSLGYYPGVSVVDSGGSVCLGDVQYTSVNSLVVNFAAAFSGSAYLS